MRKNLILNTDSYKFSQFNQYPPNTEYVFSYIESRGGIYDELVFLGTQMFIREYLANAITWADIQLAYAYAQAHGVPFNREGWQYIVDHHNGRLPIEIRALDEGTVIGTKQILLSIVNTDPKCYWLTSYLETALLRAIWYPTTVATNSRESRKLILDALEKSGDPTPIDFKLHDFGARGVSSYESAGLGGFAHIVNFKGTDTIAALEFAYQFYDADIGDIAFSVPAMEHSTVTSWTRDGEVDSYRNMIRTYGKPGGIVSIVADSYNIFNACDLFGTELKDDIIETGCKLVVRPDSGDPAAVAVKCLQRLEKYFGSVRNDKGYKVLNNVAVLWGDGINHQSIRSILFSVMLAGFSADNMVFGQGGALLQMNNRDDLKFAMKCSAAYVNGEWVDVYKDPITDPGKKSKKGRLALAKLSTGYHTVQLENLDSENQLKVRFINGRTPNQTTLSEIRARVNNG